MENREKDHNFGKKNGYDIILDTYNSHKYPVIENQVNAVVFPWTMQRDIDYIDPARFYGGSFSELSTEQLENVVRGNKERNDYKNL